MKLPLLLFLAAFAWADSKGLTLRGTVVDGVSGRPIRDAELRLQDLAWQPVLEPTFSDGEGRFVFRGLPAGEYILSADTPETGQVFFEEPPEPGWAVTVHMKAEEPEKTVTFKVIPRAVVTGAVRDEFGDPVPAAMVTLYRPAWSDGRTTLEQAAQTATDDRGRYRAARLAPGGYVVCVNAPQAEPVAASAGAVDFAVRPAARVYARACYPERGGSKRSLLKVTPGGETEVNLTLDAVSASEVHGRIAGSVPPNGTSLQLVRDTEIAGDNPQMTGVDEGGVFVFRGVLPGRYRLEASATVEVEGVSRVLTARVPVDVGGTDVAVEVALTEGVTFDVSLRGANGDEVSPERVQVGLRSTTVSNAETFWAQADPSGEFRISGVPAGAYRVITRTSASDISCIDAVMLGDRNVLRGMVMAKPGMNVALDVIVSRKCGAIIARVASGAKVLLLLSGSAKNPEDVLVDYAGPEGELKFTGLGAGQYRLWAWQVDTFGSFVGPAALENVDAQSVVVDLKSGEHATIDVPLLRPEGAAK